MIVRAATVADELKAAMLYRLREDPDYLKWYHTGAAVEFPPKVDASDWHNIERVSLGPMNESLEEPILGYLAASVSRETNSIDQLMVISFVPGNPTFRRDLRVFVEGLIERYVGVRFSVVAENPAQKVWRRFAEQHGGAFVGFFPNAARLEDGMLYDLAWYYIPGKVQSHRASKVWCDILPEMKL